MARRADVLVSPGGVPPRVQQRQRAGRNWLLLLLAGGRRNTFFQNVLFVLGGASIVVSAAIHLHLWTTGYSAIQVIGPLFLVQSIAGFAVAVTVVAVRRLWAAAIAVGYLLATVGGFLLSVNVGLFGFQDTWLAPFASAAFWDEAIGAVLLLAGGAWCVVIQSRVRVPPR